MKQQEKDLFKELCKFKSDTFQEDLLPYATPHVLGKLFFNRMQGVAFTRLTQFNLTAKVNREFRNSLGAAYEQNAAKNNSFLQCVREVSKMLMQCGVNAAMLKGALLCAHYPDGCRTSNDIDLLVMPQDVTSLGKALDACGFRRGHIRDGRFVPATRREIISSKMMRGETVPYIKEVGLPYMPYSEVDINFSLDYKNGDTDVLSDFLGRTVWTEENGLCLPTLCQEDFFLHLCAHLYKEATTLPWIKMHRDMTLYKYCDLYMLISEMKERDLETVWIRAKKLNLEKVCAYAVSETAGLFDIEGSVVQTAKKILREDPDFIRRVVSPEDKKTWMYQTEGVTGRFFMDDRTKDLMEVCDESA